MSDPCIFVRILIRCYDLGSWMELVLRSFRSSIRLHIFKEWNGTERISQLKIRFIYFFILMICRNQIQAFLRIFLFVSDQIISAMR